MFAFRRDEARENKRKEEEKKIASAIDERERQRKEYWKTQSAER